MADDKNSPLAALDDAVAGTESVLSDFRSRMNIGTDLTAGQRKRLIGVKSRNYGFIAQALEILRENPGFGPPHFDPSAMSETVAMMDKAQQLTLLAGQLRQLAEDLLMTAGDAAYRDALRVYGSLGEQHRANVAGAEPLYQALFEFFESRGRRPDEAKPTQRQLERDFKRLMRGKADGEIIVKHETPHATGGVHEVIDDVGHHR